MDRFGISPTIMNETLRILRDKGLIRVRPGTGGGIFIAQLPPQVRLGAVDLWFNETGSQPLDLFEARLHLEVALAPVAFDRATDDDIAAMRGALEKIESATEARTYIVEIMNLHRVLVEAAHVPVLDGMHQVVVTLLQSSMGRAVFVDGHQSLLAHSVEVHVGLVDAIEKRDRTIFDKILRLHHDDLVRVDDPSRSPDVHRG